MRTLLKAAGKQKAALRIAGLCFALFIFILSCYRSEIKYFWLDEGFDATVCHHTLKDMLLRGANAQCSPNPLFYPFQKLAFSLPQIFSETILLRYRLVSIGSASFVGFLLFYLMGTNFGIAAAIGVIVSLTQQDIFFQFAAENRPYMFWLLIFSAWLTSLFLYAVRSRNFLFSFLLLASALALSLTAAPGFVQVLLGLASLLSVYSFYGENKQKKASLAFMVLVAITSTVIGVFYAIKACKYADGGENDLLNSGNLVLLQKVASLIFSAKTPLGFLHSLIFLLGLLLPFSKPFKRITGDTARTLSILTIFQLLAVVPVSYALMRNHYFFVQKMFIFLVTLKALGASLGIYLLAEYLHLFFRKYRIRPIILAGLLLFALLAGFKQVRLLARESSASAFSDPCVTVPEKMQIIGWENRFADNLNFIARVERLAARCPMATNESTAFVTTESAWRDKLVFLNEDQITEKQKKTLIQVCKKTVQLED